MARTSVTAVITAVAILASSGISLAQSAGGGGSAVGSPNAGSTGAGNSAQVASPPAPGTNSAGTAQSSGANTQPGMTTGATGTTNGGNNTDAVIAKENQAIDRKLNSICRGC